MAVTAHELSGTAYTQVAANIALVKLAQSASEIIFLPASAQPADSDPGFKLKDGSSLTYNFIQSNALTGALYAKAASPRHQAILHVLI